MVLWSSARPTPRHIPFLSSRPQLETLESRFAPGSVFSGLEANILLVSSIEPQADTSVTIRRTDRIMPFADAIPVATLSAKSASESEKLDARSGPGGGGSGGHGNNGLTNPLGSGSLDGAPIPVISKVGSPSTPKNLRATVSEDQTGYLFIHLRWVYEELDVSHFDVNRAIDHSPFNLIAQVSFQTNKENYDYTDGPVTKGPHYEYCVKAVNGVGKSACARVEV